MPVLYPVFRKNIRFDHHGTVINNHWQYMASMLLKNCLITDDLAVEHQYFNNKNLPLADNKQYNECVFILAKDIEYNDNSFKKVSCLRFFLKENFAINKNLKLNNLNIVNIMLDKNLAINCHINAHGFIDIRTCDLKILKGAGIYANTVKLKTSENMFFAGKLNAKEINIDGKVKLCEDGFIQATLLQVIANDKSYIKSKVAANTWKLLSKGRLILAGGRQVENYYWEFCDANYAYIPKFVPGKLTVVVYGDSAILTFPDLQVGEDLQLIANNAHINVKQDSKIEAGIINIDVYDCDVRGRLYVKESAKINTVEQLLVSGTSATHRCCIESCGDIELSSKNNAIKATDVDILSAHGDIKLSSSIPSEFVSSSIVVSESQNIYLKMPAINLTISHTPLAYKQIHNGLLRVGGNKVNSVPSKIIAGRIHVSSNDDTNFKMFLRGSKCYLQENFVGDIYVHTDNIEDFVDNQYIIRQEKCRKIPWTGWCLGILGPKDRVFSYHEVGRNAVREVNNIYPAVIYSCQNIKANLVTGSHNGYILARKDITLYLTGKVHFNKSIVNFARNSGLMKIEDSEFALPCHIKQELKYAVIQPKFNNINSFADLEPSRSLVNAGIQIVGIDRYGKINIYERSQLDTDYTLAQEIEQLFLWAANDYGQCCYNTLKFFLDHDIKCVSDLQSVFCQSSRDMVFYQEQKCANDFVWRMRLWLPGYKEQQHRVANISAGGDIQIIGNDYEANEDCLSINTSLRANNIKIDNLYGFFAETMQFNARESIDVNVNLFVAKGIGFYAQNRIFVSAKENYNLACKLTDEIYVLPVICTKGDIEWKVYGNSVNQAVQVSGSNFNEFCAGHSKYLTVNNVSNKSYTYNVNSGWGVFKQKKEYMVDECKVLSHGSVFNLSGKLNIKAVEGITLVQTRVNAKNTRLISEDSNVALLCGNNKDFTVVHRHSKNLLWQNWRRKNIESNSFNQCDIDNLEVVAKTCQIEEVHGLGKFKKHHFAGVLYVQQKQDTWVVNNTFLAEQPTKHFAKTLEITCYLLNKIANAKPTPVTKTAKHFKFTPSTLCLHDFSNVVDNISMDKALVDLEEVKRSKQAFQQYFKQDFQQYFKQEFQQNDKNLVKVKKKFDWDFDVDYFYKDFLLGKQNHVGIEVKVRFGFQPIEKTLSTIMGDSVLTLNAPSFKGIVGVKVDKELAKSKIYGEANIIWGEVLVEHSFPEVCSKNNCYAVDVNARVLLLSTVDKLKPSFDFNFDKDIKVKPR